MRPRRWTTAAAPVQETQDAALSRAPWWTPGQLEALFPERFRLEQDEDQMETPAQCSAGSGGLQSPDKVCFGGGVLD